MGRGINTIISLLALIALSPVFLLVSLTVWVSMGRPIFFKQRRPGLNGSPFLMYKFRSMKVEASNRNESDDLRVTKVGRFLRKTSLDELPELINVLKGEMSLVGPRPLLMEYLPLYSEHQKKRMDVCPGITGWAQINGRNSLSWEEKFDMDVWYVNNRSVWLDMKIIVQTVVGLFGHQDISQEGFVGAEKFKGNKK